MEALTNKQRAVLDLITAFAAEKGFPPSIREVAAALGISTATAQQHIDALRTKGSLSRSGRRGRALTVTGDAGSLSRIPLVASIAAGVPIAVEDQHDSYLDFAPHWFGSGKLVAVNVLGDSMSGDNIGDGDVAVIRLQQTARPKEIAAVRVDRTEVTLKRIQLAGSMAHLVPSNPEHSVRIVDANAIEIVGVLAGILRRSLFP